MLAGAPIQDAFCGVVREDPIATNARGRIVAQVSGVVAGAATIVIKSHWSQLVGLGLGRNGHIDR